MAGAIDITVKVNGGIFSKNIPESVRNSLREEVLLKVNQRMTRQGARGSGGKGLGVQRNTVGSFVDISALTMTVESTHGGKEHWPRVKGTAWQRKNIGIIRAMAPRVLRKAADRIVAEMGS